MMIAAVLPIKIAAGTQHPNALPTLRWRPERVNGIPIALDTPDLSFVKPIALFHENESPGILNFLAICETMLMSLDKN